MDTRSFVTLELNKILEQVARYAAFSGSYELLVALEPTSDLDEALRRQQITREARTLLEQRPGTTVGGARDVRRVSRDAHVGVVLTVIQLTEIKTTLQAGAVLRRTIEKASEWVPMLAQIATGIQELPHLVREIEQVIDENGEVKDSASPKLARIRQDLRQEHNRLQTKLNAIVNSAAYSTYLQENLITIRNGRYVIPIKAEARGRVQGIVHDQSASGATIFIEPLSTVEINNHIRELELEEQDEVARILGELSALVGADTDAITWTVETLAELDAAFARAKYAFDQLANPVKLVGFDPSTRPGSFIRLYNARHPLLDPRTVVPIDVEMYGQVYMLIITGPNTGGKTVSLKTVGLLTLMAQCGLQIPAAPESVLTVFENVLADIGTEQSIEQSLSTFSAHMTHVIEILRQADDRSLVILDELGSGTDPGEGSALATAILSFLLERRITTFVATHYPELKLFAHNTAGVQNASVEFDSDTLSPTYRLIIGLPGRSNALAIARRLGLPEAIIEAARAGIATQELQAETLLEEIHRTRLQTRQTQAHLETAEAEVVEMRRQLSERLHRIEEERRKIVEETRREANSEIYSLQLEIETLRKQLAKVREDDQKGRTSRRRGKSPDRVLEEIEARTRELAPPLPEAAPAALPPVPTLPTPSAQSATLSAGDRVFIPGLATEGDVMDVDTDGDVEVQVGALRVRVKAADVEKRKPAGSDKTQALEIATRVPDVDSPGLELHIRGYRLEEALPVVEAYLDQAYAAGLPWVRIVHGKGSGTLRKAVHNLLRDHSLVLRYSSAPGNQGGDGVTVVYFASLY